LFDNFACSDVLTNFNKVISQNGLATHKLRVERGKEIRFAMMNTMKV
jgi:hypothetical protein